MTLPDRHRRMRSWPPEILVLERWRSATLALVLAIPVAAALGAEPDGYATRVKSCDLNVARAAVYERLKAAAGPDAGFEMMAASEGLLRTRDTADAVFWFYAGQLRARDAVAVHGGDRGQILQVMLMTNGPQVNNAALQDVDMAVKAIDRVLKWDRETPNPEKTGATTDQLTKLEANRAGLRTMQDKLRADKATFERQAREAAPEIQAMNRGLEIKLGCDKLTDAEIKAAADRDQQYQVQRARTDAAHAKGQLLVEQSSKVRSTLGTPYTVKQFGDRFYDGADAIAKGRISSMTYTVIQAGPPERYSDAIVEVSDEQEPTARFRCLIPPDVRAAAVNQDHGRSIRCDMPGAVSID